MPANTTTYEGSFQQLADARRALKVTNSLRKAPVLPAEDRMELERIRALAIRCIESAAEELITTLDVLVDPDCEPNGDELDGSSAEEDIPSESGGCSDGPGCSLADPDSAVDDRPCDDINMDLEPGHDAEIETWSHADDHPSELFVGRRSGHTDEPPEAA